MAYPSAPATFDDLIKLIPPRGAIARHRFTCDGKPFELEIGRTQYDVVHLAFCLSDERAQYWPRVRVVESLTSKRALWSHRQRFLEYPIMRNCSANHGIGLHVATGRCRCGNQSPGEWSLSVSENNNTNVLVSLVRINPKNTTSKRYNNNSKICAGSPITSDPSAFLRFVEIHDSCVRSYFLPLGSVSGPEGYKYVIYIS